MTFKQSKLLDIFLKDCALVKYEGNGGYTLINKVISGNSKLINLNNLEIKELRWLIENEYNKTNLFLMDNNSSCSVNSENIKIFLKNGGFRRKYINNFFINFIKYVLPFITIGVLIFVHFIKESELKPKTKIEINKNKKELLIKDTIQPKKIDLKKLNEKGNHGRNSQTNKSE